MPELPDLTLFVGNLRPLVCGKEITQADIFNLSKVSTTKEAWKDKLCGQSIADIRREGKEVAFLLTNDHRFNAHLMLAGRFLYGGYDQIFAINSKIFTLGFADGQSLTLCDSMRMANVRVNPRAAKVPDVLDEAFTEAYFLGAAKANGTKNVKDFLTDQAIMLGIGNAYADEILYAARISPLSYMIRIPQARLMDLYRAIPETMLWAIDNLQKLTPDAIAGEERSFLRVHNRKKTHTDDGQEILKRTVGRRTTYYTKTQELFL